jgi:hypothetical protein
MFRDKVSDAMKELVAIANDEPRAARELSPKEQEAVAGAGLNVPGAPRPGPEGCGCGG